MESSKCALMKEAYLEYFITFITVLFSIWRLTLYNNNQMSCI